MAECNRCGKVFQHPSSKSRHQTNCKKGEPVLKPTKMMKCPNVLWCNAVFHKTSNFKRHLYTCRRKEKSEHVCVYPDCKKIFKSMSKLSRHQSVHKKPSFTCERCFVTYTRQDKFSKHQEKCKESATAPRPSALHHMPCMVLDMLPIITDLPTLISSNVSSISNQLIQQHRTLMVSIPSSNHHHLPSACSHTRMRLNNQR